MDLIQLSDTVLVETIETVFSVTLVPGVALGFAAGSLMHLIGFGVFRTLSLLNTK